MALLVSHNCLSAIDWFPYKGRLFDKTEEHQYNDIIRAYYDELYKLNVEVDIIELGTKNSITINLSLLHLYILLAMKTLLL